MIRLNKCSLSNPDLFKFIDVITQKTHCGHHQECYCTEWQRLSGCGPSAASNLIFYMNYTKCTLELEQGFIKSKNCLQLMEEIWEYVTPTPEGIPTTKLFYEDVILYTKSKGINVDYYFCDLPKNKANGPDLNKIIIFLEEALLKDSPVAFLNLCNGKVENLDPWHWTTIISLEYEDNSSNAFVYILDEGIIKKIDLELWYNTTTLGGGFVYFTTPTKERMVSMNKASIYSISISSERGQLKKEVPEANFIENYGIENDGHAGDWGRQVTCLNWASVENANKEHKLTAGPGDFAENILIDGLDFLSLSVGSKIRLGGCAVLEVTQIGKEDHPSIVSKTLGVSLLPSEGVFCKVIKGCRIKKGDSVEILL